ncbi:MAG: stage V sporulation protein AB, partial [Lachnospiraceae bacterium]|nr:stage V sporulation protein AB [Lachnospiraceae bacterium]
MLLRQALLFVIGISAGGVIAAGIFAFLAIIGVFPRIIGETGTRSHIILCETMMIIGGTFGNIIDLYHMPELFGGPVMLVIWGTSIGIFVGCLVMSLAETLKALPVLCRRIHFAVGLQYVILSIALG